MNFNYHIIFSTFSMFFYIASSFLLTQAFRQKSSRIESKRLLNSDNFDLMRGNNYNNNLYAIEQGYFSNRRNNFNNNKTNIYFNSKKKNTNVNVHNYKNYSLTNKMRKKVDKLRKKSLNLNFLQVINLRNNCTNQVCYPPLGNLLVGRSKFLFASSTCGMYAVDRFCVLGASQKLSTTDQFMSFYENNQQKGSRCSVCDSRTEFDFESNNLSHRIENVIYPRKPTQYELDYKWWQSENGLQRVFIQFDLESEFILANVYINFKSLPPATMVIEKSNDYGVTWQTIAYFASNCQEYFPGIPLKNNRIGTPICISRYSQIESTRELIYRPLYGHMNPDPNLLARFFKVTNLRFNFTQLHMFGDNLFTNIQEDGIMSKYYYAIKEIRVMGTCFCNGHASHCNKMNGVQYDREYVNYMVHSKCHCEHYTDGHNCERCLPLYNDLEWKPAANGEPNECKVCECNGHSNSCHFSKERYLETNRISGGVCDNCMHNTEGPNCERCKANFYHDKSIPFHHKNACKPCKCNSIGSQDLICNKKECTCKRYVEGVNCDTCMNGYWNLSLENGEDGCKKCDCNLNGTVGNLGCNKETGQCYKCKQNVIGEKCDKCKLGYYGLSSYYETGCVKCNCASGFSYSNFCHHETGQCTCKPHVYGKRCNIIEDGYFCASIDHLLYEAEDSILMNDLCIKTLMKPSDVNRLTGLGYLLVNNGGKFKFNIMYDMETSLFDVVMRYEINSDLENIHVRIMNLGPDINRPSYLNSYVNRTCYDLLPGQSRIEERFAKLTKSKTGSIIYSKYCFEKYYFYEIEITFNKPKVSGAIYNSAKESPSIKVDSIVLVPNLSMLIKNEEDKILCKKFEKANLCRERYFSLPKINTGDCDKLMCVVTTTLFGLLPCQCNPTGSKDPNKCKFIGGQCNCKPNIATRQCSRCKPNAWGFSDTGCEACICDSYGSKDNICDFETGQCHCKENSVGKSCDRCMLGYYNPPRCEKCNCNGFSEICTSTGVCLNCQENTEGFNCERCKPGYYGSPINGIPCKPCGCPGINGNNFANECSYDYSTESFKCNCLPGYTGKRCDKCDTFYYGNPLEVNGSCKMCNCYDNNDKLDPNSCNSKTGECKNCLYNTYGLNCERCKPGYSGNALAHDCKPCNCNKYGTEKNSNENCDSEFGHCSCLPNVIGKFCDECAQNYWNLESGEGCIPCDCDITGTKENGTQCDQKEGQCVCIPGRGGRKCDECPFGFWGTPSTGCKKCMCSSQGISTQQCDRVDGHCKCIPGVTGYYCDRCDRGTTGEAPFCKKCGECFESWDQIIFGLFNDLEKLEKKAVSTYASIGTKATNLTEFYSRYDELTHKIKDISIITDVNLTSTDKNLLGLNSNLKTLRDKVNQLKEKIEKKIAVANNWQGVNAKIASNKDRYENVNNETVRLLKMAMTLKESFITGANESIHKSKQISDKASEMLNKTIKEFNSQLKTNLIKIKDDIEKVKLKTESVNEFSTSFMKKSNTFYEEFDQNLQELNFLVCGTKSLNCSNKCGGLLCDKCGFYNETIEFESEAKDDCSNAIQSSYLKINHLTNSFKNNYEKKEHDVKKYLSKININKIVNKKSYEEILDLKNSLNNSINMFALHSTIITDLLNDGFRYGDKYQMDQVGIESNCKSVLNTELDHKEEELDLKLNLIQEELPSVRESVDFIQTDLKGHRVDSIEAQINQVANKTDRFIKRIETLNEKAALIDNLTRDNEFELINFTQNNAQVKNAQKNINITLENIKFKILKISDKEKLIEKIIESDRDTVNFDFNNDLTDKVKKKLNNGKLNLEIDVKLKKLAENLQKLIERIQNSLSPEKRDHLIDLIKLHDRILQKEKEYIDKQNKIDEYRLKKLFLRNKINKIKSDMEKLRRIAEDTRQKIKDNTFHQKICH